MLWICVGRLCGSRLGIGVDPRVLFACCRGFMDLGALGMFIMIVFIRMVPPLGCCYRLGQCVWAGCTWAAQ